MLYSDATSGDRKARAFTKQHATDVATAKKIEVKKVGDIFQRKKKARATFRHQLNSQRLRFTVCVNKDQWRSLTKLEWKNVQELSMGLSLLSRRVPIMSLRPSQFSHHTLLAAPFGCPIANHPFLSPQSILRRSFYDVLSVLRRPRR